MRRIPVILCGVAAGILVTAATLYVLGPSCAAGWLNSLGFDGSSLWPVPVLSVMVTIFGLSVRDNLVAQKLVTQKEPMAESDPDDAPNLLIASNVVPSLVITVVCGLGLLAWPALAVYR